jgi:hypothetical protein
MTGESHSGSMHISGSKESYVICGYSTARAKARSEVRVVVQKGNITMSSANRLTSLGPAVARKQHTRIPIRNYILAIFVTFIGLAQAAHAGRSSSMAATCTVGDPCDPE